MDHTQFLGQASTPPGIYDSPGTGFFYSPFNLSLDPMDRLALIDFKGNPQYQRIELQVFDDRRGKGALAILYRKDRKVDIYCTKRSFVNYEPNEGRIFIARDLRYRLQITESGLDLFLDMHDNTGQRIEVLVKENRPSKQPAAFLAPAGSFEQVRFTFFPIFFMKEAYFVQRAGTEIFIRINGKPCEPDTIPLRFNGSYIYQVLYVKQPVIAKWNLNVKAPLPAIQQDGFSDFHRHATSYELTLNDGHYEIRKMKTSDSKHTIFIEFSPAIANLAGLKQGVTIRGRFSAGVDDSAGIFAGEYRISRTNGQIELNLYPQKAWEPLGFAWVKSYSWLAQIQIKNNGQAFIQSEWVRQ